MDTKSQPNVLLGFYHRLLPPGSFTYNVAVLASGSALGQGLLIIATPILTRLYTPAEFGVLGVFTSIFGILWVASALRYDSAIPLPEDDRSAVGLLILALILVLAVSALSAVVLLSLAPQIAAWTNTPVLARYLWLLPFTLAGGGVFQCFNFWSTRRKHFAQLAVGKITQALSNAVTSIVLGLIKLGALGLLLGATLGYMGGAIAMVSQAVVRDHRLLMPRATTRLLAGLAKTYRVFPSFQLPSNLVNAASQHVPILLLAALYSADVAGQYSLALRIFTAPMFLIVQAFSQVFFQRTAEAYNQGEDLRRLVVSSYHKLFLGGFIPTVLLLGFAPLLCGFVFGAEWTIAGEYCRLLIPWLFLAFIVTSSTWVFSILRRQDILLSYELVLLAARLAAIVLGWYFFGSPYWSIALYSLAGMLGNFYIASRLLRLLNSRSRA